MYDIRNFSGIWEAMDFSNNMIQIYLPIQLNANTFLLLFYSPRFFLFSTTTRPIDSRSSLMDANFDNSWIALQVSEELVKIVLELTYINIPTFAHNAMA